jgi:hypothetical protein
MAARAAVRAQVKLGADWIKVHATGGVLDNVASGTDQQFKDDELIEIVTTAHMLGRKVAAHAHGAKGLNAALRAGVDTIEHGTFMDAESIELFNKTGAWYVPTIIAGKTVEERAKVPGFFPPNVAEKARAVGPKIQDALRRALAGGVKIGFAPTRGVFRTAENARGSIHGRSGHDPDGGDRGRHAGRRRGARHRERDRHARGRQARRPDRHQAQPPGRRDGAAARGLCHARRRGV